MSEFDIRTFTNHRDTESTEGTIFFARSGDGDRAKDLSPAGTIYQSGGFMSTVGSMLKSFRQRRRLFSLAVRLPAREKTPSSVFSG